MREMNERDLAEAIAESNSKTLSQRADEAVAWYLLHLRDMVRRARNAEELEAMLAEGHEQFSLKRIWEQRHPPKP